MNMSCLSRRMVLSLSHSPTKSYQPKIGTKAFICILSASIQRSTSILDSRINKIMTTTSANDEFSKILWDGSDKSAFASLTHPGYSTESNPDDFTGGWRAHRKVWEENDGEGEDQPADWVKETIGDITKLDYESMEIGRPPRILVLYGSLRPTSFSRKTGMFSFSLTCEVYDNHSRNETIGLVYLLIILLSCFHHGMKHRMDSL